MDERLNRLERRLEELASSEEGLLERVKQLEEQLRAVQEAMPAPAPELSASIPTPDANVFTTVVSLLGRALVVLGGAYLLRALTESGAVPRLVGMGIGLAYALSWLFFARRAAKAGKGSSGAAHGLTAAAIAYPLLWEGALRSGALGAIPAAVALGTFTALCLAISWRWQLASLAWAAFLPAGGSALLLMFRLQSFAPFGILLVLLVLALLWMARDRWSGLRWTGAFALDVAMTSLVVVAAGPRRPEWLDPRPVAAVLVLFGALYLGFFVWRALQGKGPGAFEAVQGIAALLLGVEGGLQATPSPAGLAIGLLAAGALLYGIAWRRVTDPPSAAAWYLTSIAAVLALEGARVGLPAPASLVVWGSMALAAGWLSARAGGLLWSWQAAFYAAACAIASSMPAAAWDAFTGGDETAWRSSDWTVVFALLASGGACALMLRPKPEVRTSWWRVPAVVALAFALIAGGALLVDVLAGPIAGAPSAAADRGLLAALRTGAVASAAVLLAILGRRSYRELAWLVYPLLLIGGFKLLLEDVSRGRPATMFVSLVLFGGALIGAPWMLRREARRSTV